MTDVTRGDGSEAAEPGNAEPGNAKSGAGAPKVTLAECDGAYWLVGGEEYLDDFLIGELAPGIAVEVVNCTDRAEMMSLWEAMSAATSEIGQPWALNPRLMVGVLGRLGLSGGVVQFSAWSAAMGDAAESAISGAAAWLHANGAGTVVLRQFLREPSPPGAADLQRLRSQLVRGALERAGAPAAALREETLPLNDPRQAEQLLLVKVPAPS